MWQSANYSLALGFDMFSRPRQLDIVGCGPCMSRENMAPKVNPPMLTWAC